MKILKIFGLVVGIHVFALVLIFANPGCSSSTKPPPAPMDTVASPAPTMSAPINSPAAPSLPESRPAISFNPDAPALPNGSGSSAGVRYNPTRPGTPVATTLQAEPVSDVTPVTTYTVKSGDSLWTIAKKHQLSVTQLASANSLPISANLKPNQKLVIPGKSVSSNSTGPIASASSPAPSKSVEAPVTRPSTSANGGSVKHTVKSGETLGAIARTYGVKPGDIAVANNISDPAKIRSGMELSIPGWNQPAAKSGKSAPTKSGVGNSMPKAPTPAAPATINVDTPPELPAPASQVPVIRIDDGTNPILPAPKGN